MLNSLQTKENGRRYTDSLQQGSVFGFAYNAISDDFKPFAPEHGQVRGIRNVEILI